MEDMDLVLLKARDSFKVDVKPYVFSPYWLVCIKKGENPSVLQLKQG